MFPFTYNGNGCISVMWGTTKYATTVPNGSSINGSITIAYSGRTMTWYHYPYSGNQADANAHGQLNSEGVAYAYLAIG